MTNIEILREAQAKVIANSKLPDRSIEEQIRDLDLIADITELIIKYKRRPNHES